MKSELRVLCVVAVGATGCLRSYILDREGGVDAQPDALPDARLDVPVVDTVDTGPDVGGCDAGFAVADGSCAPLAPPRQIAPLSTSTVTSRRPTFHWVLAPGSDGAHVQVCGDRPCTTIVTEFDATGTSGAPSSALPVRTLFWRIASRAGGTTANTTSATWEFAVGSGSSSVDTSWGTFLDVNGDGFADVAVGANGNAGHVYVYLGHSATGVSITPDTTLDGPDGASGAFGTSVVSAGDVNGDGISDLIVGGSGGARVYPGGPSGLVTTSPPPLTGSASQASSAGDVNGDGYADVIVAGTASNTALVYLGGPLGISMMPSTTLTGAASFGQAVASAGDVNGDGAGDVIVGAPDSNLVYLFVGTATAPGVQTLPDVMFSQPAVHFGLAIGGAGDVNGDGFADVAVGAWGSGEVFVYSGGPTGPSGSPAVTLQEPVSPVGYFGWSVAGAGDVNGDGFADLIVGAPQDTNANAYLYYGSATGLNAGIPLTQIMDPSGGGSGQAVAGVGDVDGNGLADFTIGEPFAIHGGAAFIYWGQTFPTSLMPPTGSSGFGSAIARTPAFPSFLDARLIAQLDVRSRLGLQF